MVESSGLLNRRRGNNLYRGFESLPLRHGTLRGSIANRCDLLPLPSNRSILSGQFFGARDPYVDTVRLRVTSDAGTVLRFAGRRPDQLFALHGQVVGADAQPATQANESESAARSFRSGAVQAPGGPLTRSPSDREGPSAMAMIEAAVGQVPTRHRLLLGDARQALLPLSRFTSYSLRRPTGP